MEANNKQREALRKIKELFRDIDLTVDCPENEAYVIADAALAAPPRNCDVGTVEEQQERFAKYCRIHSDAHECGIGYAIGNPKAKCPAYKTIDCQLVWAQMPYEEGGAK